MEINLWRANLKVEVQTIKWAILMSVLMSKFRAVASRWMALATVGVHSPSNYYLHTTKDALWILCYLPTFPECKVHSFGVHHWNTQALHTAPIKTILLKGYPETYGMWRTNYSPITLWCLGQTILETISCVPIKHTPSYTENGYSETHTLQLIHAYLSGDVPLLKFRSHGNIWN